MNLPHPATIFIGLVTIAIIIAVTTSNYHHGKSFYPRGRVAATIARNVALLIKTASARRRRDIPPDVDVVHK